MTQYPDCMMDLETTGTAPDRAAIIQIAAVRFNLATGEVDADNMFDRCLSIPPHRFWQEDTRLWWSKQPSHVLQGIQARMEPPARVMEDFIYWCGGPGRLRLFAKPTSFELPFIQSYCADHEYACPFNFRDAIDCRSFLTGHYYPDQPLSDRDIPFEGDAHNAIFDVLHQLSWMFQALERRKNPIPTIEGEILPAWENAETGV